MSTVFCGSLAAPRDVFDPGFIGAHAVAMERQFVEVALLVVPREPVPGPLVVVPHVEVMLQRARPISEAFPFGLRAQVVPRAPDARQQIGESRPWPTLHECSHLTGACVLDQCQNLVIRWRLISVDPPARFAGRLIVIDVEPTPERIVLLHEWIFIMNIVFTLS